MEHLNKIIEMHGGSKTALANHLKAICPGTKISQAHINNWLTRDGKVPPEWIIPCCISVDFKVIPHQISPDIYPHPDDGLPENLRHAA
jgi:hypothetical protein